METPIHHEEKKPHHPPHEKNTWSGWTSPVGLGIFFITTSLALAILLYTVLNLVVSASEALHPQSQGMSAQELQQLEQQSAPASSGATGGSMGQ